MVLTRAQSFVVTQRRVSLDPRRSGVRFLPMVLIFFLLPMMCLTFAFEDSDCVGVVSFVRISFAYGATSPMASYVLVLHVVATRMTHDFLLQ